MRSSLSSLGKKKIGLCINDRNTTPNPQTSPPKKNPQKTKNPPTQKPPKQQPNKHKKNTKQKQKKISHPLRRTLLCLFSLIQKEVLQGSVGHLVVLSQVYSPDMNITGIPSQLIQCRAGSLPGNLLGHEHSAFHPSCPACKTV